MDGPFFFVQKPSGRLLAIGYVQRILQVSQLPSLLQLHHHKGDDVSPQEFQTTAGRNVSAQRNLVYDEVGLIVGKLVADR
jgi:hypothetical protein